MIITYNSGRPSREYCMNCIHCHPDPDKDPQCEILCNTMVYNKVPMKATAIISKCGKYRYTLSRIWDKDKPKVLFIMLNPSTADADKDDPTIRRCIGFAKSWGFGGLWVGNLLAYRATNPKDLKGVIDPFGPDNEKHLKQMASQSDLLVCAWGNPNLTKNMMHRTKLIKGLGLVPHFLELSKDGTPKHPLYLKSTLEPKEFYT